MKRVIPTKENTLKPAAGNTVTALYLGKTNMLLLF